MTIDNSSDLDELAKDLAERDRQNAEMEEEIATLREDNESLRYDLDSQGIWRDAVQEAFGLGDSEMSMIESSGDMAGAFKRAVRRVR